jgi:hypothetical protein
MSGLSRDPATGCWFSMGRLSVIREYLQCLTPASGQCTRDLARVSVVPESVIRQPSPADLTVITLTLVRYVTV